MGRPPFAFAWSIALGLSACTGTVDGTSGLPTTPAAGGPDQAAPRPADAPGATAPGGAPAGPQKIDPADGLPAVAGDPNAAGPVPLRRLSKLEYAHTLRDLLGETTDLAAAFPDEATGPSGFVTPQEVSGVEISRYREAAETAAARALERIDALAPCAAGANQEACAATFIDRFGRRAFRRPLDATEKAGLLTVYKTNRATPIGDDYKGAVRVVLQTMLQAPQFLYHWELGPMAPVREGALVKLNPHELASRLSYFLWASMPDDALFAAADANALGTPEQVAAQAKRLLADPRAGAAVAGFFAQVLETEGLGRRVKDKNVYPAWSAALGEAYGAELDAFVKDAVLAQGSLTALLTGRKSFVNEAIAKVYKGTAVTGAGLREVTLDENRPGVLTRGAFLASQANTFEPHPVLRGKIVLSRFLCQEVPPPPPGVDNMISPPAATQQTRERFAAHSQIAECAACHKALDPLGFAFEQFDGIGAYRTMDAGRPVDATGAITLDGKETRFANARELVTSLADSHQARHCAALQWLRFGLGRQEVKADEHSLTSAVREFGKAGWDLKALMVAIASSKTFRYRSPSQGEVLP